MVPQVFIQKRWHHRIGSFEGLTMYMAVCVWLVCLCDFDYDLFFVFLRGEMERFVRICV